MKIRLGAFLGTTKTEMAAEVSSPLDRFLPFRVEVKVMRAARAEHPKVLAAKQFTIKPILQ